MRFRYSLRALLLFVTLVCVGVGWLALPTLRARDFVSAMGKKDYAAAERLFINQAEVFPGGWKDHQFFEPRVFLKPLTWNDLARRERQLAVAVSYCDGSGIASCTVEITATEGGLEKGMAVP